MSSGAVSGAISDTPSGAAVATSGDSYDRDRRSTWGDWDDRNNDEWERRSFRRRDDPSGPRPSGADDGRRRRGGPQRIMEAGIMAIMDVRDTLAEIKKKLFEPTIERRMAATPGSAPSSTVGGALMRKGKMKPGMKPGTKPAMKPKPGFVDVKIPPAMGTIVSALQSIQGVSANLGALGAIQMKVDELSDSYKSVNAEALAAAKAAANDANAPTNNAATANEAPANEAPANEAPANEAPANDAQEGGRRRRGTKRAMRNKRKRGTRR